jgi:hypothetical protein
MIVHDVYVLSFVAQGTMVLMSYCVFWPDEDLWAGLRDPVVFKIWAVSALVSAVAFCSFSYYVIEDARQASPILLLTSFPYALFLMSAALYMPFATHGYKAATIFSLFLTAVSACVLVYCSVLLYDWSWVTCLMCVLAFHCGFIDLIFWGYTWNFDI